MYRHRSHKWVKPPRFLLPLALLSADDVQVRSRGANPQGRSLRRRHPWGGVDLYAFHVNRNRQWATWEALVAVGVPTSRASGVRSWPSLPTRGCLSTTTERDLRHVAVGRKNWLIFASPRGWDVACRQYSLVLSCKQSGVDPEAYIADVLAAVSTTPAGRMAELTPRAWAARQQNAVTR
jgi:hypothetical protein